jgi:hypothetical protein
MRRIFYVGAAAAAALMLSGGSAAYAAGAPVENVTGQIENEVSVTNEIHPCTGEAVELTQVMNGVVHVTVQADGTTHFSGTIQGTFAADVLPADGIIDTTGTFVAHFGSNGLLIEDGAIVGRAVTPFSFTGEATNADGSTFRWHANGNTVYDTTASPKLELFHEWIKCS